MRDGIFCERQNNYSMIETKVTMKRGPSNEVETDTYLKKYDREQEWQDKAEVFFGSGK